MLHLQSQRDVDRRTYLEDVEQCKAEIENWSDRLEDSYLRAIDKCPRIYHRLVNRCPHTPKEWIRAVRRSNCHKVRCEYKVALEYRCLPSSRDPAKYVETCVAVNECITYNRLSGTLNFTACGGDKRLLLPSVHHHLAGYHPMDTTTDDEEEEKMMSNEELAVYVFGGMCLGGTL